MLNLTNNLKLNQTVPMSQARAQLPKLLEDVKKKDFIVLMKKYKPQVALVDLQYLNQLLEVYNEWQRKQAFKQLDEIRQSLPQYPEKEVAQDIADALKAVRKT